MELPLAPLESRFVRLEPYAPELKDALRQALDVDPETWAILATRGEGPAFEAWWDDAVAQQRKGQRVAYVVRRLADDRVVGTSSYLNIRRADGAVEIGSTFYHPDARGGVVNPACKRLLIGAAFEAGARRVELMVDAVNRRSQAAVGKLGAVREGILRQNKLTWTGRQRDTVCFSIIADEWPAVRDRLDARLAAFA